MQQQSLFQRKQINMIPWKFVKERDMEAHQERMSNTGDDALSHQSAFGYTTSLVGFTNEFSGLWPLVCLGNSSTLPLSPSLQYCRDNQQSLCLTPYLFMCGGLLKNQATCRTDTMPSLALHTMLCNTNLDKNSGLSGSARHCNIDCSSVAEPFFKVPKSRAIKDSAKPVPTIANQVNEMEQSMSRSVQPERETALLNLHNNKQPTKVKLSTSSIASASVAKRHCRTNRPKRALTAYNLFFKEQREQILRDRCLLESQFDSSGSRLDKKMQTYPSGSHNRIGFEEMGKIIGQRWQVLDRDMRRTYEARAQEEKRRYREELAEFLRNERKEREAKFASLQASVSEDIKHRYFSSRK